MSKKIIVSAALSLSALIPLSGCGTKVVVIPSSEDAAAVGSDVGEKQEDEIFRGYLRKIYSEADEYRDGRPMLMSDKKLLYGDADEMRLYKEYALADIDSDGTNELLILSEYGKAMYMKDPGCYEKNDKSFRTYNMVNAFEADANGNVVEKSNYLGTRHTDDLSLADYIIKDNNTICMKADSEKIDYSTVGSFDLSVLEEMGFSGVSAGCYVIYWYVDEDGVRKYDLRTADDGSDGGPVTDEKYAQQMRIVNAGNAIDPAPVTFTAESLGIQQAESQTQETTVTQQISRSEDERLLSYLKNIYNTSGEIIKGHPAEVTLGKSASESSWKTFRNYAIADFDSDGADELILHTYGPYTPGMAYGEINLYNQAYPTFEMYEISGEGHVVNTYDSYNIEGDVWMLKIENDADYSNPSLFTFYGNGVMKFEAEEGGERKEAYYIFNNDIHRQLTALGHHLFKDKSIYGASADGLLGENGYSSALCYVTDSDGRITRLYGSHQDNVQDAVSKQEYDEEIAVLTAGGVIDTGFKEFDAQNLNIEARSDTLNEIVKEFSTSGTYREIMSLSGEVYRDETTSYGNGNPEPCTVLKLDLPFLVVIGGSEGNGGQVTKIDEIQLFDQEGYDLMDVTGHHSLLGLCYWGQTIHHHRPMLMEVSDIE